MPLRFIDVSNNNGFINWATVAASQQIDGVAIKVSQGVNFKDAWAHTNINGARAHNLEVALYHFANADLGNDPVTEARWYNECAGTPIYGVFDVLDIELPTADTEQDYSLWALSWLEEVHNLRGTSPMVYSYPDYITHHLKDARLAKYGLWLASYSGSVTPVAPWTDVAAWQYSDNGHVNGVYQPVDMDTFYGDRAQWHAYGPPDKRGHTNTRGTIKIQSGLKEHPKHGGANIKMLLPGEAIGFTVPRWEVTNDGDTWIWIQSGAQWGFVPLSHVEGA